ncbi:MAG TPA: sugar-binding protein [Spirochaetia bacterium]|nr:sugar-binding protein [Spirochaetia bacterium]
MKRLVFLSIMIVALVLPSMAVFAGGGGETSSSSKFAVGVVLPTKDEERWTQDETRFRAAFKKAGVNVQILFSEKDSAKEKANVESLISTGVKAIIICPVDASAAAAAADEAHAAGIKVISYDRLIRDSANVDYYVTFDSVAVGAAWSQYLVDRAAANGGKGLNLYVYAGAASDNNAFLFFQGAWQVIQPKIADGTFKIVNSSEAIALQGKANLSREEMARIIGQVTTNWSPADAKNIAESNLTAASTAQKGVCYVLSPNDQTARAIGDAFAADKAVTKYYTTGQDADKSSIQYIIDGKQSMTVLKDVRTLVSDAIAAAVAYLKGQNPPKTNTYNNGKVDVPAKPSAIVSVTKDNVKAAIIDSGYYPANLFTGL